MLVVEDLRRRREESLISWRVGSLSAVPRVVVVVVASRPVGLTVGEQQGGDIRQLLPLGTLEGGVLPAVVNDHPKPKPPSHQPAWLLVLGEKDSALRPKRAPPPSRCRLGSICAGAWPSERRGFEGARAWGWKLRAAGVWQRRVHKRRGGGTLAVPLGAACSWLGRAFCDHLGCPRTKGVGSARGAGTGWRGSGGFLSGRGCGLGASGGRTPRVAVALRERGEMGSFSARRAICCGASRDPGGLCAGRRHLGCSGGSGWWCGRGRGRGGAARGGD